MSSPYTAIEMAPPDIIFGISAAFKADTDPRKLNLGVGAYRTEEGLPWVLPVVRKVEKALANAPLNKEYLPISGLPAFTRASAELLFGKERPALNEGRICTVQCLSGTGSLRIAAEFVHKFFPKAAAYVSDPTWGNHNKIFGHAGITVKKYRYYKPATRGLDFEGMSTDIAKAPRGSLIVLHTCAHNPTGVDPTQDQWRKLCDIVLKAGHLVLFDTAYQGFASGDVDLDGFAPRLFVDKGVPILAAQSYAKNFGLYAERVGALNVACSSPEEAARIQSQLCVLIRGMYSNPPVHGARIVEMVLNDHDLYKEWRENLSTMSDRIKAMRRALFEQLQKNGAPGNWDHILNQIGMFSYTGLTEKQCDALTERFHVYLTRNGRISMAGLSASRAVYLATAIKDVVNNP